MHQYEVTYFDIRGLAEPIRLLLAYIGEDWKDNRIPYAGIGKSSIPDEVKAKCLFGQVPLLEFDGQRLNQSQAIMRFLGRRHNLAGKDDLESAKVDEIADGIRDMTTAMRGPFMEPDETKKAEKMKEFEATCKSKFLPVFNSLAEKNGGYLVGNSRTWVDILAAYSIDNIEMVTKINLLADFPALKNLVETVLNSKGIKEHIANRKETEF